MPETKESGIGLAVARLREGTEILRTGGGTTLTAAQCNLLLAERDALREALTEVGKWLSIQDSPPIGTNAVLVEIERALGRPE